MALKFPPHQHQDVVTIVKCQSCGKFDYDGNLIVGCLECELDWRYDAQNPEGYGGRYHAECLRESLLEFEWDCGYPAACGWCDDDFDMGLLAPAMQDVVDEYRSCQQQQKIVYVDRTYCYSCSAWIPGVRGQDYFAAVCPDCLAITCTRCKEEYHEDDNCQSLQEKATENLKNFRQHIIDTHLKAGGQAQGLEEKAFFEQCPENEWQLCPACFRPVHPRYMYADGANKCYHERCRTEFCPDCKGYCGYETVRSGMDCCWRADCGGACGCGQDENGEPIPDEDDEEDTDEDAQCQPQAEVPAEDGLADAESVDWDQVADSVYWNEDAESVDWDEEAESILE